MALACGDSGVFWWQDAVPGGAPEDSSAQGPRTLSSLRISSPESGLSERQGAWGPAGLQARLVSVRVVGRADDRSPSDTFPAARSPGSSGRTGGPRAHSGETAAKASGCFLAQISAWAGLQARPGPWHSPHVPADRAPDCPPHRRLPRQQAQPLLWTLGNLSVLEVAPPRDPTPSAPPCLDPRDSVVTPMDPTAGGHSLQARRQLHRLCLPCRCLYCCCSPPDPDPGCQSQEAPPERLDQCWRLLGQRVEQEGTEGPSQPGGEGEAAWEAGRGSDGCF